MTVLTIALAASLALAVSRGWVSIRPEWSPWEPLDLDAPPNFLTRYKLSRLSEDTDLCARVLTQAAMTYRPIPDEITGAECGLFDVAGFVLADGRRVRVLGDWSEDSPEASFLHEVRDGACRFFDGVLSPDFNAAHRDHLHLDRGTYRYCR